MSDHPDDEWGDDEIGAVWSPEGATGTEHGDPEGRAARRTLLLAGAAVAAIVLAVVASFAARELGVNGDDDPDPAVAAVAATGVGPAPGADLAAHQLAAGAALEVLRGGDRRVAVVSLVSYRSVAAVDGVLAQGAPAAEVLALLAAAPGGAPSVVVGTDLTAWAAEQRTTAQSERDAIAELLPTVTDPEFIASYQAELDRYDRLLATLDPEGELVFGAVVRADAATLRTLAGRADVRLVDVGADDRFDPDATVAAGLRPEETVLAGDPPQRP